jgi:hypothetical protein
MQARNAALRREKDLMARHYGQLKAALDKGRAAAAERLKQLSVMSGTAMQVGVCVRGGPGQALQMVLMALSVAASLACGLLLPLPRTCAPSCPRLSPC